MVEVEETRMTGGTRQCIPGDEDRQHARDAAVQIVDLGSRILNIFYVLFSTCSLVRSIFLPKFEPRMILCLAKKHFVCAGMHAKDIIGYIQNAY